MSGNLTLHLQVIDSLVPSKLHEDLYDACLSHNWYFGNTSVGNDAAAFWKMDLDDNPAASAVWDHVKPRIDEMGGRTFQVLRQYANGHTYGLGGQAHIDDDEEGTYTLLYYPMPRWELSWGGETVYYGENGEIFGAVVPKPNRAVFFDSRILHAGRAPSRSFGGLRVSVAFKLQAT